MGFPFSKQIELKTFCQRHGTLEGVLCRWNSNGNKRVWAPRLPEILLAATEWPSRCIKTRSSRSEGSIISLEKLRGSLFVSADREEIRHPVLGSIFSIFVIYFNVWNYFRRFWNLGKRFGSFLTEVKMLCKVLIYLKWFLRTIHNINLHLIPLLKDYVVHNRQINTKLYRSPRLILSKKRRVWVASSSQGGKVFFHHS